MADGAGADQDDVALAGGIANSGAVVRVGETVRRPATRYSPLVRAVVTHLEAVGFDRAPWYLGSDGEGRDVFTFIEGEVAVAPYPDWAQRDEILREVGALLRDFHEAMSAFDLGPLWSPELADPQGGEDFCHNDVCPENVVFRDGRAVALLDFDVAPRGALCGTWPGQRACGCRWPFPARVGRGWGTWTCGTASRCSLVRTE